MKKLNFEEMEEINGGHWLNNHTLKEHLICIGQGVLAAGAGPIGTAAAMVFCYLA
jgi:lactobin A/cerein 7B family class IIb bacteriocin